MTRFLLRFPALFLTLLNAPAALAVDGVLEINQTSVAAAGGFPLTISQSGSYRLTGNLVVPSGSDGIEAAVDDVSIDFNGFSLIGPGSCAATIDTDGKLSAVSCSGLSGTGVWGAAALSNGTIRGFDYGVQGLSDRAAELDHMLVTQNGIGLDADGSLRIDESRFSVNGSTGANTLGSLGNAVVRNSTFERNGGYGLYLSAGVASHCSLHQNLGEGIRSNAAHAAVVDSSYFEDNGIGLFGNANVGYRGNTFFDNTTNVGGLPIQLGDNLCDGALCP